MHRLPVELVEIIDQLRSKTCTEIGIGTAISVGQFSDISTRINRKHRNSKWKCADDKSIQIGFRNSIPKK